jgi:hypothetical protein
MYKIFFFTLMVLLVVGSVSAQDGDWQTASDGFDYNCNTLNTILASLEAGKTPSDSLTADFVRYDNGTVASLQTYLGAATLVLLAQDKNATITSDSLFASANSACNQDKTTSQQIGDSFNVVVNGDVNLRSCAGTNCDIVQKASNGSMLTVIGTEGDWYKVQLDDSTAYIASWLTTRGPDALISVDDTYTDEQTGCVIAFNVKRGDPEVTVLLSGDGRGNVTADLYRPNETRPLRVEGQLDKTFIDTGDAYIHQYYSWNVSWPKGMYQLELNYDDKTSKLAWEMDDRADYYIYVMCD